MRGSVMEWRTVQETDADGQGNILRVERNLSCSLLLETLHSIDRKFSRIKQLRVRGAGGKIRQHLEYFQPAGQRRQHMNDF